MKANDKISLVISSVSLILLVLLFLLFNCGFEIANLRFFTVHQILSQILHFGGHGLYRSGSALIHTKYVIYATSIPSNINSR